MKDRIKELRTVHLKITQDKFAEAIRTSANYIYMLEKGERKPSKKLIDDICSAFCVNEEWLCGGDCPVFSESAEQSKAIIWLNSEMAKTEDSFKKRFLLALSNLSPDQWDLVEDFMNKVCGGSK